MSERERIARLIREHEVVLFMKGTRGAPACGFSARVVDILDDYLEDYVTVDVLVDAALREEIKAFSSWPTLPQLYVRGQMIGGADIVGEMAQAGELAGVLGRAQAAQPAPAIAVTEAAMRAFAGFWEGEGRPVVRLTIGAGFEPELDLSEERKNDVVVETERLVVVMDRASARRAEGVQIDFVEQSGAAGFKVDVPMAPPRVKQISVSDLTRMRESAKPMLLIDVRTPEEHDIASIEGAVLLDQELSEKLEDLDRDTPLVALCHHGMRSQQAAQHFLRMGFRDVSNVQGGIDAWSVHVDPKVPRY